jgi:trk system potassium uptake protein TrkA
MKSVLVIGIGRFGRHLANKMQELGNEVMVIDKNEKLIEQYQTVCTDAYVGDCTNEGVLRSIGVQNFDLCFVTIGEDFQSSLVITSLLKKLGAQQIIAKAKRDVQADLLKTIGANEVVYPERVIAERLAVRYNSSNIFDYIELTSDYAIYEIPILKEWISQTIEFINARRKYKINIIAVKSNNELNIMPGPDYKFVEKDHVIVVGKSTDVFKITSKASMSE